jgi:hypothetical protein
VLDLAQVKAAIRIKRRRKGQVKTFEKHNFILKGL